ncbi:hypothetical protein GCM10011364_20880 [Mangrovimonas yunxiaonensis]|nr:hypothetical protein GCM10011364_20880 [Mangrovimonas yunxiaonensis]
MTSFFEILWLLGYVAASIGLTSSGLKFCPTSVKEVKNAAIKKEVEKALGNVMAKFF